MKKILLCLSFIALACLTSSALPFSDAFTDLTSSGGSSYAVGSALGGQHDGLGNIWNAIGTSFPGPAPTIVAGNLGYAGLPPSTGNSVSFVGASAMGDRLNFNAVITNGTRAYYSYLLKITDISSVPTNAVNNYFAGFSDGTAGQTAQLQRVGTRVLTKKVGGSYVLGVGRNNTTTDYVYDTTLYNVGDTLFLVGSYEVVGGVTNVNLWIDPPSSSFGTDAVPTPTVSAVNYTSTTGNLNTGGVQGFVVLCQFTNAPSGVIDDLRVGTNWSAVTGGDPALLSVPASQTLPPGSTATFSVTARGTPTLTYQWLKDGGSLNDGGNILGSATATLKVNNISAADVGSYTVLVMNGLGGSVQSPGASLNLLTDPIITGQPQNVTDNFGDTATFTVIAGGTAPFSYQWHKDGVGDLADGGNVSGSHSNVLTLSGVAFADGGNYSVTVSNSLGMLTSATAQLTVNDPYFSTQPMSATTGEGGTAVFQVAASGSGSFTYQWFKNGNYIFDLGNLMGTSTAQLTISNVSSNDQANYYATVTGPYSTATSSVVTLTVLSPVAIAFPPSPRTVVPGVRTILVVGATGSGPIQYQWQLNGANITNATAADYVIADAEPAAAGNYVVVISNSFSAVTSAPVALTVSGSLTLARTNLEVIRVGDGAQTLTLNGNSLFLDQYAPDGTYVNTVTIPDSGPSAMIAIGPNNASGGNSGSVTGTSLTRSLDGQFMVIAGYNTNVGYGASLKDSVYTAVPRGIATIESHAQYDLAVADTNFSGFSKQYWRSGVTDGTNNFWGAASFPGTYYFGFDSAPAVVQTNFNNPRNMALFNSNIYCISAVASANGVLRLTGMPRTADTPTLLFATGSTGSSDLEVNPAENLIYVADDRAATAGGGVQRWDFDGSTWSLTYTITNALPHGVRYLTADFGVSPPVVYAIGKEVTDDNDRLVIIPDTGANSSATTVAYSGVNQTFRGIRFGPIVNTVIPQPVLGFSRAGNDLVLSWSGSFILQSAPNATGTYADIVGATSPYTNSLSSPSWLFFRLRH